MCPLLTPVVVFGPVATTWFNFLARNVVHRNQTVQTVARVACDQGIFAPIMIGVFLSSMATLEGTSPQEKLDRNYRTALTSNYYIWPAVQAVNFTFIPPPHRLLFVNVISVGWNCYLSFLNSA
jgi:protein Mpv17